MIRSALVATSKYSEVLSRYPFWILEGFLMVNARDILNKLVWDKRFRMADYAVVFVHRGAPHDLKVVRADAVSKIEKSFLVIDGDTMIPFHRVRAIRNTKTGQDIYSRSEGVPFPLWEIEGHEDLGPVEDRIHDIHLVEPHVRQGGSIRCGARLSFPEERPELFRKRIEDGKQFGMVELSFFEYDATAEVSAKYDLIAKSAEKAILDARLEVGSLHLPNANILSESKLKRIFEIFIPFCESVGCNSIVVHPGRVKGSSPSQADRIHATENLKKILSKLASELEKSNTTLSVEVFHGKHRTLSSASQISRLIGDLPPVYRIAYDTSHTIGDTDAVIEDIVHNLGWINVFHFSNRNDEERHMPIFAAKGQLDFDRIIRAIGSSRFNGLIILEYQLNKYRTLVGRDLQRLRSMIDAS